MEPVMCKGMSVGYEGSTLLRNINFTLEAGTLTVLIGANGSGKSTLLRTLAGVQRPLAGKVFINGISLEKINRMQLAKQRAIVNTWRQGGGALTVEEAVSIGRSKSISLFGGISQADRDVIMYAIESVGVTPLVNRYLSTLSDGEKQKVMIARALAQDTPIVFLDEPTAFLDVAARIEIMELLQHLSRKGKTIILSTHDIAPAVARADYLMIADRATREVVVGETGQMIREGVPDRAFTDRGVHFDTSILDFR